MKVISGGYVKDEHPPSSSSSRLTPPSSLSVLSLSWLESFSEAFLDAVLPFVEPSDFSTGATEVSLSSAVEPSSESCFRLEGGPFFDSAQKAESSPGVFGGGGGGDWSTIK